jgi:hypothetical protein
MDSSCSAGVLSPLHTKNSGAIRPPLTDKCWRLIRPYLNENERLFGIRLQDLLTVEGILKQPDQVYRKVSAVKLAVLAKSK